MREAWSWEASETACLGGYPPLPRPAALARHPSGGQQGNPGSSREPLGGAFANELARWRISASHIRACKPGTGDRELSMVIPPLAGNMLLIAEEDNGRAARRPLGRSGRGRVRGGHSRVDHQSMGHTCLRSRAVRNPLEPSTRRSRRLPGGVHKRHRRREGSRGRRLAGCGVDPVGGARGGSGRGKGARESGGEQ